VQKALGPATDRELRQRAQMEADGQPKTLYSVCALCFDVMVSGATHRFEIAGPRARLTRPNKARAIGAGQPPPVSRQVGGEVGSATGGEGQRGGKSAAGGGRGNVDGMAGARGEQAAGDEALDRNRVPPWVSTPEWVRTSPLPPLPPLLPLPSSSSPCAVEHHCWCYDSWQLLRQPSSFNSNKRYYC
jgi:hypothetical protein